MWFDGIRQPDTLYVANTSRGKDSTAMLRAIQLMGWPLDMICSVDIWATQDIPAELPPMVAFKDEYDKKVLDWFGVPVTRLCASTHTTRRLSYADMFYGKRERGKRIGTVVGFPMQSRSWCKKLKSEKVDLRGSVLSRNEGENSGLPNDERELVYQRTQEGSTLTPWSAPERGAEDKYRSLSGHRGGRAAAHCQAYAQERQGFAAGSDRMG